MLRNLRFLAAGFVLGILLSGTLSAQSAQTRQVASFSEIQVGGSFEVQIVKGNRHEVVVITETQDVQDDVLTEVNGSRLRIRLREDLGWGWRSRGKITVRVTAPSLTAVGLGGSGRVYSEDDWTGDRIDLSLSGSGQLDLAVRTNQSDVSLSGSGRIRMQGQVGNLKVRISGSGDVEAAPVKANNADVRITGSGSAQVSAAGDLEVHTLGSGSVSYHGTPRSVNIHQSGSGRVRKVG